MAESEKRWTIWRWAPGRCLGAGHWVVGTPPDTSRPAWMPESHEVVPASQLDELREGVRGEIEVLRDEAFADALFLAHQRSDVSAALNALADRLGALAEAPA